MNPRHRKNASNHLLFTDEEKKQVYNAETLDIEYSVVFYRKYGNGIRHLLDAIIIKKNVDN